MTTIDMDTGFGWVQIGEERFENDIVVHVDGTITKRRKKLSKDLKAEYGHTPLSDRELDILKEERPEVVIVGMGQDGALPVTPKAKKMLDKYDVVYQRTQEALVSMAREKRPFVAIIHVTC
jgi:hypothetical protein